MVRLGCELRGTMASALLGGCREDRLSRCARVGVVFASKARYGQGPALPPALCHVGWLSGSLESPNGARHTSPG